MTMDSAVVTATVFHIAFTGLVAFAPARNAAKTELKAILVKQEKPAHFGSVHVERHIPFIVAHKDCKLTLQKNAIVHQPDTGACAGNPGSWACLEFKDDDRDFKASSTSPALDYTALRNTAASMNVALPGAGGMNPGHLTGKEDEIRFTFPAGKATGVAGKCFFPHEPSRYLADYVAIELETANGASLLLKSKDWTITVPATDACLKDVDLGGGVMVPPIWIKNLPKKLPPNKPSAGTYVDNTHFRRFYELLDRDAKEFPVPKCPGRSTAGGMNFDTAGDPVCPPSLFP